MSTHEEQGEQMFETSPAHSLASALVVDDDPGIRQSLRLCLEAAGGKVLGVGTAVAALDALDRTAYDVVLLDLWLGTPETGMGLVSRILARQAGIAIIVITAFATFESAVQAMKLGATDYLPKPFTPDQVRLAVERALNGRRLAHRIIELEARLAGADVNAVFRSRSPAMRAFLETAHRAATSNSVVLLQGESGTGKSVLAHWICAMSGRRERPFVMVNCPTLSSDSMSGVLFGRSSSEQTGDVELLGKVQEAEGGTLFLDEVADLTADAQARLLRLLTDRSYERLGDPHERRADVRIVAATSKSLAERVQAGTFREDLLFRLDVVSLDIPPLRDRREDIPVFAELFLHFFESTQGRPGLSFADEACEVMQSHAWPGNLRELRNAIERAVIVGAANVLCPRDLGLESQLPTTPLIQIGAAVSLEDVEREHIARIVSAMPTLEAAARTLGIDATTLGRKRKRYGLS
jgi:two-component system, NtrC family, response regulator AlgB